MFLFSILANEVPSLKISILMLGPTQMARSSFDLISKPFPARRFASVSMHSFSCAVPMVFAIGSYRSISSDARYSLNRTRLRAVPPTKTRPNPAASSSAYVQFRLIHAHLSNTDIHSYKIELYLILLICIPAELLRFLHHDLPALGGGDADLAIEVQARQLLSAHQSVQCYGKRSDLGMGLVRHRDIEVGELVYLSRDLLGADDNQDFIVFFYLRDFLHERHAVHGEVHYRESVALLGFYERDRAPLIGDREPAAPSTAYPHDGILEAGIMLTGVCNRARAEARATRATCVEMRSSLGRRW